MFGLSKLWAAISRLTSSLNALADTAELVNTGVRSQLQLEDRTPHELPQAPALLPGTVAVEEPVQPQARNGRKGRATTTD